MPHLVANDRPFDGLGEAIERPIELVWQLGDFSRLILWIHPARVVLSIAVRALPCVVSVYTERGFT